MAEYIKLVIYLISFTICYALPQDPPHPIIDVCTQISPCSCKYNNGIVVDLTPLSNSNNSDTPRFHDIPSEIIGSAKYSWNPCNAFTEGTTCINVTLCEVIAGAPDPKYVPIGKLEDGVFDHNVKDGGLQLQYSIIGEENRTAYILLFCNATEDGNFIVKGEEIAGSGKYFFELRSKHVCGAPVITTETPVTTTAPLPMTTEKTSSRPIIDSCTQTSPCRCEYSNGDTVDMTLLSNDNSSNPRFKDMPSEIIGGAKYSWNPCHSFTEGTTCKDVALCEIIAGAPDPLYVPIGKLDDAVFDHNIQTGDLQLQYTITGGENRTSYITLKCNKNEDGQFIVIGEEPAGSGKYYFELESKHVCRSAVAPTITNPSKGLSPGAIIAIILFSLIGVYLIGGMAYQKCVNKATGKEIIPNYQLWSTIASSIKAGVVYVFTCGRSEYTEMEGAQTERTPIQGPQL